LENTYVWHIYGIILYVKTIRLSDDELQIIRNCSLSEMNKSDTICRKRISNLYRNKEITHCINTSSYYKNHSFININRFLLLGNDIHFFIFQLSSTKGPAKEDFGMIFTLIKRVNISSKLLKSILKLSWTLKLNFNIVTEFFRPTSATATSKDYIDQQEMMFVNCWKLWWALVNKTYQFRVKWVWKGLFYALYNNW
jgi:hypothetical protein